MDYVALSLAIVGYMLLMLSNPVRGSLRNGWRCVRRYPVLWRIPAWMGFAGAAFMLVHALWLHFQNGPPLVWVRAGWYDPSAWLGGTPDSLWWLPPSAVRDSLGASWLPSIESLAGLFNCAVSTFPIAVFGAVALFTNRGRLRSIMWEALRKRMGGWAWLISFGALLCGAAVLAKGALYFRPQWIPDAVWFQWAPMVMWPAALFETVFGLGVQAYLILHAYAWVRGITFEPEALREVAVRRLGAMAKWAGFIVLAQTLLLELPLALSFACEWPATPELVSEHLWIARLVIAAALIVFASMQAWLTLHGETLPRAWNAHWRLVRGRSWLLLWYLLVAAVHLVAVSFLRAVVLRALGENTACGLAWTLVWPWIAGLVVGWLLASWVCLFKRCEQ